MNPTQDVVEERVAALEGGVAALLVASGQAAETLAILNIAEAGDHIVSSPSLYGGTYNLFHYTLPKLGIEVSFVDDPDDLDAWRAAVRPNTKAFFGETIAQPQDDILDIEGVAAVAHEDGVPLIVDNTVATPYLIRPLRVGRRHRRALGHEVPRRSRHGDRRRHRRRRHVRLGGQRATSRASRRRTRATTASSTPSSALGVRPQGARAAAARPRPGDLAVQRVPDRAGPRDAVPAHGAARGERAGRSPSAWKRTTRSSRWPTPACRARPGTSAPRSTRPAAPVRSLAFEIAGGLEAGKRFVDALELHSHVANIGDVRVAGDPPGVDDALAAHARGAARAGVTPGLVRLAVGIEGIDDILADLDLGFAAPRSDRRSDAGRQAAVALPPDGVSARRSPGRRGPLGLERGGGLPAVPLGVRDVGRARAEPRQRGAGAARADRRRARRRPGRARSSHPGLVGRADRARRADRHRPLVRAWRRTCSAAARARPGHRRRPPTVEPWGSRFPGITVRDQVAVEARLLTGSASTGGPPCSAARWAACGRWSG